jgi:hypothetical protein
MLGNVFTVLWCYPLAIKEMDGYNQPVETGTLIHGFQNIWHQEQSFRRNT